MLQRSSSCVRLWLGPGWRGRRAIPRPEWPTQTPESANIQTKMQLLTFCGGFCCAGTFGPIPLYHLSSCPVRQHGDHVVLPSFLEGTGFWLGASRLPGAFCNPSARCCVAGAPGRAPSRKFSHLGAQRLENLVRLPGLADPQRGHLLQEEFASPASGCVGCSRCCLCLCHHPQWATPHTCFCCCLFPTSPCCLHRMSTGYSTPTPLTTRR